jgi:hypothetical protein
LKKKPNLLFLKPKEEVKSGDEDHIAKKTTNLGGDEKELFAFYF